MSNHADERQNIIADLQGWIRQNRTAGAEWYLDEGDQPAAIPMAVEAGSPAPVAEAVADPEVAHNSAPPTTPANDKEAAFQIVCDRFVAETMALVRREHEAPKAGLAEEPLLAELDAGAVIADGHRNEWETWLPDPRVHNPSDWLTGGRLDGVPQIVRLGVLVRVQTKVMADTLAERLLAEVLLQHAQK